jgi:hypothetical protein
VVASDPLERLRPLAGETVISIFGLAMSDAVEKAFGEEVERIQHGESEAP